MQLDPTERVNLTLSASAVAASYAIAGPQFASDLAVGAALEALNFRALHRCSQALFSGQVLGGSPWVAVLGLRFALLAAGIALAIGFGVNPLALVLGLSVVIPATLVAAIAGRPPVLPAGSDQLADALPPDDPSWDTYSIWRSREVEPEQEDEDR